MDRTGTGAWPGWGGQGWPSVRCGRPGVMLMLPGVPKGMVVKARLAYGPDWDWSTPNALEILENDMHTMFNVISIIRCNWGWFVTTIPCCNLFAINKTTIVHSLVHVREETLHYFLHHCRHIAGIIPLNRQIILHKSDGHQLSAVTDNGLEQFVADNDIFLGECLPTRSKTLSICWQF